MIPNSLDVSRLQACVDHYCAHHRHPDRAKFIAHDVHTMTSWEGTAISYKAGCYALYSGAGELLYIGKASNSKSVESRLVRSRYNPVTWDPAPAFVQIVEVSEPFEAPSLEEFLITELQPRFNDRGIKLRTGL
jgi:hypothetical protein